MSRMHVCKEICTFCICVELSVYRHSVYCSYLYIYICTWKWTDICFYMWMQLCKFIFPRGREHKGLVCSAHSVFFPEKGVLCLFLKAIFGKRGNDRHFCHFFWETGLTPAVHSILIFPQTDDLGLPSSSDRLHRAPSFFHVLFEGNDDQKW